MNDDNPLWYDHAEVEVEDRPGVLLQSLAAAFVVLASAAALAWRVLWLPDRLWLRLSTGVFRLALKVRPARR